MVSDGDIIEEADRWLATSKKLLAISDFHGAKELVIRACKADPSHTNAADYILAISDTILAGESTIRNSKSPEWYAILRLVRLTQNLEHIATQYRRLALLLDPTVNRLPFANQALKLVSDAWSILSDPSRKSMYDRELQILQIGQFGQFHSQSKQFQNAPFQRAETRESPVATNFWTACPFCFTLFEYPKGYEECMFRCQYCNKAFEAVKTQTPPVECHGEGVYFCSWAVFPLGFSSHAKTSVWSPVSSLFISSVQRSFDQQTNMKTPPTNIDIDDDLYVVISDDDDDDDDAYNGANKSKKGRLKVT